MDEDEVRACLNCGREVSKEEELQDYHGDSLCLKCYKSRFDICQCCGDEYDRDYEDRYDGAWGNMCIGCAEEHFICDECGDTYNMDEYAEDGYCNGCYRDSHDGIKEYHEGADCDTVFHPNSHESLYFGIELETEDYPCREEAALKLNSISKGEKLFWLEQDGSLNDGIEIISQPCTLDYHRDKFPWKQIMDIVKKHWGKAHNTDHAALHIHFSKDFLNGKHSELYQLRLIYLFEKFRDELIILGRTSDYLMRRSAKKYDRSLQNTSAKRKIRELRNLCDRLYAVNLLTNKETIEIRIFRSTLTVNTLLASIELVDFLVRLAKKTSNKKLQRLTWVELVELIDKKRYLYLPQYITKLMKGGDYVPNCSEAEGSETPEEQVPQEMVQSPSRWFWTGFPVPE